MTGQPGPELRSQVHVHDLPAIERELARIWSGVNLTTKVDGVGERRIAARTSVMNLVVIAARPEVGERCADVIARLSGRHPSRTLILMPSDPDGPSWIDADIQAHCLLPRSGSAEACSERIYLKAGGQAGRHLAALVAPLVIHDLPVTVWWPGDIPFDSDPVQRLLDLADRLVVDGSSWAGDGRQPLQALAGLADRPELQVSDFALIRQSRWREAIASTFDLPELQPFLRSFRRIVIGYAAGRGPGRAGGDGAGGEQAAGGSRPGGGGWASGGRETAGSSQTSAADHVNIVKPLYHVGWLASRLRLAVDQPLEPAATSGYVAVLRQGRRRIPVELRPEPSELVGGTTLRVELEAVRRAATLRVTVTAGAATVMVDAWRNDELFRHRPFPAARRTEVDMLAEVIESVGQNRIATEAIRAAANLAAARGRARALDQ
jgi:glucose-6-phosphate dehydrogenase assembly protein OpcA